VSAQGWIGVDLDGTLAHYDGWEGIAHIGAPVQRMAARVRRWLDQGREVRILTARYSSAFPDREDAARHIQDWTEKHLGRRLRVTCEKDFEMAELWDDRAVRVEFNTGRRRQ